MFMTRKCTLQWLHLGILYGIIFTRSMFQVPGFWSIHLPQLIFNQCNLDIYISFEVILYLQRNTLSFLLTNPLIRNSIAFLID